MKCPYCAEIIQDEAKICRFCGKSLTKADRMGFPSFYEHVSESVSTTGRIDWEDLLWDYGEYLYPGEGFGDSCVSARSPMSCLFYRGPNDNDQKKIWKFFNALLPRWRELEERSQEAIVLLLIIKYLGNLHDYSKEFDNKELRYERGYLEGTISRLTHGEIEDLLNKLEKPSRFKKFIHNEIDGCEKQLLSLSSQGEQESLPTQAESIHQPTGETPRKTGLIACYECGKPVSDQAKECPRCHSHYPAGYACLICGKIMKFSDGVPASLGDYFGRDGEPWKDWFIDMHRSHRECYNKIHRPDYACPACGKKTSAVDVRNNSQACPNCGCPIYLGNCHKCFNAVIIADAHAGPDGYFHKYCYEQAKLKQSETPVPDAGTALAKGLGSATTVAIGPIHKLAGLIAGLITYVILELLFGSLSSIFGYYALLDVISNLLIAPGAGVIAYMIVVKRIDSYYYKKASSRKR